MRLPWSVSCVHASVRETEISGWVYVCLHLGLWEVGIWCMGVGMKADRMKIVIYTCAEYI